MRVDVITSGDLCWLSQRAGLVSGANVGLDEVSVDINEALHETCHTAMLEEGRNFADRAAWCSAVATRAEALATLLISTTPGDEFAPWDAHELLKHGMPSDDTAVAADLRELLVYAAPDRTSLDSRFLHALAQAAPGLRAVAIVAKRAEPYFAQQVKRGGKAPDCARRHLMSRLSNIYAQLYGSHPTVSVRHETVGNRDHVPGGRSMDWFSGFFKVLEPRLPNHPATDVLRVICGKAVTKSDALAGWINDATRQGKSKRDLRD